MPEHPGKSNEYVEKTEKGDNISLSRRVNMMADEASTVLYRAIQPRQRLSSSPSLHSIKHRDGRPRKTSSCIASDDGQRSKCKGAPNRRGIAQGKSVQVYTSMS